MAEIIVKSTEPEKALVMLKDAIAKKIARLEHGRKVTKERLENFEKKYNVTSEKFINEWAAEDLEGKDMEYVEWAGEYHCLLSLEDDLNILKSLEYVTQ